MAEPVRPRLPQESPMIFVIGKNEPALFVMLSEEDVQKMRQGNTTFVDQRQLKGARFDRVILSLHKTNQEALEILRQAGHHVPQLKDPEPVAGEARCNGGCNGLIKTVLMYEGCCITCWATRAKKLETQSN
jgi:hypothetical protein